MRVWLISLILLTSFILGGCVQTGAATELPPLEPQAAEPTHPPLDTLLLDAATPTPLANPPSTAPTQGDTPPMNPSTTNPEKLIAKAMADLAQQLGISAEQISLLEATEVMWPNAGLGCPQKGMLYAEVLTPGYLILLDYDNTTYEYHAGTDTVVTCKNPSPPVIGSPSNT